VIDAAPIHQGTRQASGVDVERVDDDALVLVDRDFFVPSTQHRAANRRRAVEIGVCPHAILNP